MNSRSPWNRMPAAVGLVLLAAFAMGADKGGCGPIDPPPVDNDSCEQPADCDGIPHVNCLGDWQCVEGACYWKCDLPEPECRTAADCADQIPVVKCLGSWECVEGACDYRCGILPTGCQADTDCPKGQHCELSTACPGEPTSDPAAGVPCQTKGTCKVDVVNPTCVTGGCSGELCVPEGSDAGSDCVYLDWYDCLKLSQCGTFGENGTCGWALTDEFEACMANRPCSAAWECSEGYACIEGTCRKDVVATGCHSNEDCATGQHCSVSDGDCRTDPNCPECDVCYGACVPDTTPTGCLGDADCKEGFTCLLTTNCPDCVYAEVPCQMACLVQGECVPRTVEGCQSDKDCPEGQSCLWTPGCRPCECPEDMPDCACSGECIPMDHGICTVVCDSTQPEACGNGLDDNCDGRVDEGCTAGCASDADCAPYETCRIYDYAAASDPAVPAEPGVSCCPAGAPCLPDMVPCNGGTCVLQAGRCWDDGNCAPDETCEQSSLCPDGAMCIRQAEPGNCVDTSTKCQAKSDCPVGQFCDFRQVDATTCCMPDTVCLMIYMPCTGVCSAENGLCWTDADCAGYQFCAITRCGEERCVGPYTCEFRPD